MLAHDLGFLTCIIIGVSIGFCGFAILIFWLQLFFKNFGPDSKAFWPFFYCHMIFWIVGSCIVPADWLDNTFSLWAKPALFFFIISIVAMLIAKLAGSKK